jgi:hypothetical protein
MKNRNTFMNNHEILCLGHTNHDQVDKINSKGTLIMFNLVLGIYVGIGSSPFLRVQLSRDVIIT